MVLNDFQKVVVKQIIDRKIWDINTFYAGNFSKINEDSSLELIEEFYSSIIDYLDLIRKLENESLIFKIEIFENSNYIKSPQTFSSFGLITNKSQALLNEIDVLFRNNIKFDIHPTFPLIKFNENDCKTSLEIEKENEEKHRNQSLKWTKYVAITSILLSIFLSICTGIFNYYTYQKERVVTIQNQKDTVRVILVDTLKK